jgi:hypothetical protein
MNHTRLVPLAALIGMLPTSPARAGEATLPPDASFNRVIEQRIRPQITTLLERLIAEGRDMQIDGQRVFSGNDKFLPGKIALAFGDVITSLPAGDPRREKFLRGFARIADLTVDDANDSWGIYYYLSALNALQRQGLLNGTLGDLTLAKLRVRLDWRTFVSVDDYSLIDHPNNYYCVAFAIARLRHALGWEDATGAQRLYTEMVAHYVKYSGEYGFADETEGEGRFDRYSVLLAAEIAQRFIETGEKPPARIVGWLRKSADVMLMRLDANGEGFEYGRSLGPYSETAMVEVLTAAAAVGVLTPEEQTLAYAYSARVARRYVEFWTDARTNSVNLWDSSRRTDAYRGKFRILGENLSLGHQLLYTNDAWNRLGFQDHAPRADFAQALRKLPSQAVTWFARGEYDRVLVTLRDRGRLLSLPLINGGPSQHQHSPYFPIPFSNGLLSGVADGPEPLLVPRFELEDGTVLMPLAYFRDVKIERKGSRTVVTWHQTEVDRMGKRAPEKDARLQVKTSYVFEPGVITRTDVYAAAQPLRVRSVGTELATFSEQPRSQGLSMAFAKGALTEFSAKGYERCESRPVADDARYRANTGAFATRVSCARGAFTLQEPLMLSWRLRYSAQP